MRTTRAACFSSSERLRRTAAPAPPRRAARMSWRSSSQPGMKSSLPALMVAEAVARGFFMSVRVMPWTTQSVMTRPSKPHSWRRMLSSSSADSEVWTPLTRL